MSKLTQKKLLITGGAGFIGSHFVKQALKKGYSTVVLDALTYAGSLENLKSIDDSQNFHFVQGSICDSDLVLSLLRNHEIGALVNFAAESHVDRSIHGPSDFIQTNIVGTFQLLSAAREYYSSLSQTDQSLFRFLQVSTDEVYGSLGPTGYFSETTPYAPNSPYSASKAAADHLVRAWHHTYHLPTLTTHCSNNYGPFQYPEKLIPTMITRALQDQSLPVYGDGGNIRDWIHVLDHCHGILLALEKGKLGETYCFGGRSERNNLDVVQMICQELDRILPRKDGKSYSSQIQFVQDRLGHDRRYAIDDQFAEKTLGFRRQYEFEQGLCETIRWYVDHQTWCDLVMRNKK